MKDLDEVSYEVEHNQVLLSILVDLTQGLNGTATSYRRDKSHDNETALLIDTARQTPMISELTYQIFINQRKILKAVTALTQEHYKDGDRS